MTVQHAAPPRLSLRQRRPVGDRGAVAVEFALILPILVMLLMGLITTGLAYSDHLAITNAAREGARLGSAIDYSTSPTTPTIWANSVQTRVQQVYFNSGASLDTSQICVLLKDSSGTTLATPTTQGTCGTEPDSPSGLGTGTCVVKVWIRKPAKINIGIFSIPQFNIGARSVSFYGRAAGSCTTP